MQFVDSAPPLNLILILILSLSLQLVHSALPLKFKFQSGHTDSAATKLSIGSTSCGDWPWDSSCSARGGTFTGTWQYVMSHGSHCLAMSSTGEFYKYI